MAESIKDDTLLLKVEGARQRLQDLHQRVAELRPEQGEALLQEALQELSVALEELYVASEQLRWQNDDLAATRGLIEAQRRHYHELFELAPDGYLVTDTRGTIQEANHKAAELLGVRQDFLLGKPLVVFMPQEEHRAFRDLVGRIENGASIRTWETVMQPRGAAAFSAAITVSTIRQNEASGGRAIGLRWLVRDMTERKWAEMALRAARDELEERVRERTAELEEINAMQTAEVAERKRVEEKLRESEARLSLLAKEMEQQLIASDRLVSIGELAASVAHEFNNPLQIIMGFAQELLDESKPSEPQHEPLKMIDMETRRCREMIRNLLDFARPADAERTLSPVEPIVHNSVRLVFHFMQISKIDLAMDVEPGLPPIYADAQQLQQVLINLLFNAAEAMPTGGKLAVRAAAKPAPARADEPRERGGEIVIAVSDTGAGISEENMLKIFRPFFSTKKKKGMGLGLSICQRIVEAHGGRIIVESEPGIGTTFALHFPSTEARQYVRAS